MIVRLRPATSDERDLQRVPARGEKDWTTPCRMSWPKKGFLSLCGEPEMISHAGLGKLPLSEQAHDLSRQWCTLLWGCPAVSPFRRQRLRAVNAMKWDHDPSLVNRVTFRATICLSRISWDTCSEMSILRNWSSFNERRRSTRLNESSVLFILSVRFMFGNLLTDERHNNGLFDSLIGWCCKSHWSDSLNFNHAWSCSGSASEWVRNEISVVSMW
jgi:hypothetical protein